MKAPFLLAALCAGPLGVIAQTTLQIAVCEDLPPSIATDTTLQFIAQEISCSNNTHVTVSSAVAVEITSAEASTKLNNVKFIVAENSSFLCTVPQLDWTSVETVPGIYQGAGGAAMRVEEGSTATFAEDVTFSGCSLPQEDLGFDSSAAMTNLGTVVFEKSSTFKDTIDGGAVYTDGSMTFEGDVIFENNTYLRYPSEFGTGTGTGGGLHVDDGFVLFKGAASFINNAKSGREGGTGAGMYSSSQLDEPMVFSGPVLFKGNVGQVNEDSLQQFKHEGAYALFGSQKVIFESHVTFEDNFMDPTLSFYNTSYGGGMLASSYNEVEFQAGVTATGNSARTGGAFYFEDFPNITMSGPVTMTDNTAQFGGAIWNEETWLTLPADADISSNTAISGCPGIQFVSGEVEFTDGATYNTASRELCYPSSQTATPVDLVEEFDCTSYVETAPRTPDGLSYLSIDTRETKTWNLGTSITGGFSCPINLVLFVTGGEELTIVSTAASATMENVRIQVLAYTKLILEVPDLTVAGTETLIGGQTVVVDADSSMDVMDTITFKDNTVVHLIYGPGSRSGGAAIYSEGDVTFYGEANFLGNGQYKKRESGFEGKSEPGGAAYNAGTMKFMKKATFKENFNPKGGNGGAIANSGDLTFNVRSLFQNNSNGVVNTDDGQPIGGRGAALYNFGPDGTIVFKGLATFKDNFGGMGGCALATRGTTATDDEAEGDNRITFEGKAKFKDNFCDEAYPSIYDDDDVSDWQDEHKGGGALLAYGASTVVFSDTAVFKRNEAPNGGAISNSAIISFVSDAKLVMEDNVSLDTCPDIENNDEGVVQIGSQTFSGLNTDLCDLS